MRLTHRKHPGIPRVVGPSGTNFTTTERFRHAERFTSCRCSFKQPLPLASTIERGPLLWDQHERDGSWQAWVFPAGAQCSRPCVASSLASGSRGRAARRSRRGKPLEVLRSEGLVHTSSAGASSSADRPSCQGYTLPMPERSRKKKRPADLNRLAASIVADATSDEPEPDPYEARTRPPWSLAQGRTQGWPCAC